MTTSPTLRLFAAAMVIAALCFTVAAGERRGPLVDARVASPATLNALRATALAEAVGVEDGDIAFTWPGGDLEVHWLAKLLDGLEASGAHDLWLRLNQKGGSVLDSEMSLGWRWPAGTAMTPAETLDWLHRHGATWTGREPVIDDDADGVRVRLGKGGPGEWDEAPGEGVNLVVATRPLVGYASLATGKDIRGLASRYRLRIPPLAEARVWPAGEHIGAVLVLEDILPSEEAGQAGLVDATAGLTRDFDNRLVVNPPLAVELLEADGILNPIGLRLSALVPATLTLGWTATETGVDWQAVGVVAYDDFTRRQFARLWAWLDLASTLTHGLKVNKTSVDDVTVRRLAYRGRELFVGVVPDPDAGEERAFLVVSMNRDDFTMGPPEVIARGWPYALAWDLNLSEAERETIFWFWRHELVRNGVDVNERALLRAIAGEEVGGVLVEGRSAVLTSPRGLALWALPALAESLAGVAGQLTGK